ncbi:protein O-mannosyl-transferase TMTC2-like [Bacillus rossius redtenbacheri]|uniref:protein O-mannosyl-transferase TMTC2-like n=1 Tax=Bacillus rossius redtenbacheri TaxID=93214 RepID=UPI002FDC91FC
MSLVGRWKTRGGGKVPTRDRSRGQPDAPAPREAAVDGRRRRLSSTRPLGPRRGAGPALPGQAMDAVNLACCLLAALLYYNTLDAGFVYDDSRAILTNQDVLQSTPLSRLLADDFWGTPLAHGGSHGSYRPLCVLTFRLNHLLGGFQPFGYHLANVCLHCLATALVVKVARALFPPQARVGVAAAGLTFAAHPVHSEAVAGVVGRADLAACVLYLASFLCYVAHARARDLRLAAAGAGGCCRRRPRAGAELLAAAGCVAAAAGAVLAKETGLTALGVCACYDLLLHYGRWRSRSPRELLAKRRPRQVLASLLMLGLALAALLAARMRLMGAHYPVFATADNPTARCSSALTRLLTFCYLPAFNFALLLCPRWLSFDWGMDAIPRVTSLSDPRNLATLLFYGCLYRAARSSASRLGVPAPGRLPDAAAARSQRAGKHRRHPPRRKDRPPPPGAVGDATTCPVCKHNLANNHHSLLCRNTNNNNNIPAAEEPGAVAQCACRPRDRRHGRPAAAPGGGRHLGRAELVLLSLAFLTIPFLPATNLFFYVGFVVAERVLYIPSVGYCLLVGVGCHAIHERTNRRLVLVCLVLLLVNFGVRTLLRNRDWHDEERLYRSGIHINPPKAYGNLGSVLSSQGRTSEAERAFRMALRHRGNMADVHYNLGVIQQGKFFHVTSLFVQ